MATRSVGAQSRCRISVRAQMSVAIAVPSWQQGQSHANLYPVTPSSKNFHPCSGLVSSEAHKCQLPMPGKGYVKLVKVPFTTVILRPSRVVENYHLEERENGKKVLKWASQKGTVTNWTEQMWLDTLTWRPSQELVNKDINQGTQHWYRHSAIPQHLAANTSLSWRWSTCLRQG